MSIRSFITALLFTPAIQLAAQGTTVTQSQVIYEVPVDPMPGTTETVKNLSPYKGKVLLLVNVASKCGLTPQYEALEALHRKYKDQGFSVVAFPSNDFGGQEPGTEKEIVEFCTSKYNVTFPLYAKLHAKGSDISPLYKHLTQGDAPFPGDVTWNFEKFLVSRDGRVIGRFKPKVKPDAPEVVQAIEQELAKTAQ